MSKRSWEKQKQARTGKARRVRTIRLQNAEIFIEAKYPGIGQAQKRELAKDRLKAVSLYTPFLR